jgi:predicted dehydrogenase
MQQLFFNRQGDCMIDEIPAPKVEKGHVLVKVLYSVISPGTETASLAGGSQISSDNATKVLDKIMSRGISKTVEIVKDKLSRLSPKGYSGAGVVVAKGDDIYEFDIGEKVAYAGRPHAEYVLVPKNLLCKIPTSVDPRQAAFTTLGSIAMHAVRLSEVQLGENVVVVGLGLIGQLAVSLLSAAGANVIGIDLIKERVDLAKQMGLRHGIVASETNSLVREVVEKTGGQGADAVLLCAATKSSDPVNQAFEYARRKAKVIMVGAMGLNFSRKNLYLKEIDFKISCSYGPGRYDNNYELKGLDYPIDYVRWTENRNMQAFLQLLSDKRIDLRPLISKEIVFGQEVGDAYRLLLEEQKNNVGILLKYNHVEKTEFQQSGNNVYLKTKGAKTGKINVGVIGAGGFSKGTLIPALKKLGNVNFVALADINGMEAKHIGKLNGFSYVVTDYRQVLADKDIDAVLIATRHNTHYQIAKDAIEAGKHVHVEKPMTMNLEEALALRDLVYAKAKMLHVGYNRRHAPYIKKIKALLNGRTSPMMTLCRVNVGSTPLSHWINDPVEGGGRLIGEVCHFIDLLYWLVGSEVQDFSYQRINSSPAIIYDRDNLSITFKYNDGSIANLFYSTQGNKSFNKEYLEVYAEGKIAQIRDFKEMKLIGFGKEKGGMLKIEDKGHFNQFANFFNAIAGKEKLATTVDDGVRVASIIEQIINGNKENEFAI